MLPTHQARLFVACILISVALSASVTFDIVTSPGGALSATVAPGDTLALITQLTAGTPSDTVEGVVYTINVPTGWVLVSRDYATYGWYQNDSFLDNSDPIPGADSFPVTIDGSTYPATAASDFYLNTSQNPLGSSLSAPGTHTVEAFSLQIPDGTSPGLYNLNGGFLSVATGGGDSLDSSWESEGFDVTVVPEPGALLVLAMLMPSGLLLRRRRN